VTHVGDGLQREELEYLSDTLRPEEQDNFNGWVPPEEVPEALNEATLLVLHQQTSLIVWVGDVQGLVEAVSYLLDHPRLAQEMGYAVRRHAQEVFNLENTADAYD